MSNFDEHINKVLAFLEKTKNADGCSELSYGIDPDLYITSYAVYPGEVLHKGITPNYSLDDCVSAMLFMCTGSARYPEDMDNDYLRDHSITPEVARDHVEELVELGVVPAAAAEQLLTTVLQDDKTNLGFYFGSMLRYYPLHSESIHPLVTSSVNMKDIPKTVRDHCKVQFEALKESGELGHLTTVEDFTKIAFLSSSDQLAKLYAAIKKGAKYYEVITSHPTAKPIGDRSRHEQPLFERSEILTEVQKLAFEVVPSVVDQDKEVLTLTVYCGHIQLLNFYKAVFPMMSFLLSKIAKDLGMDCESIRFIATGIVFSNNIETAMLYENLKRCGNAYNIFRYPHFVPDTPLTELTIDNFIRKTEHGKENS